MSKVQRERAYGFAIELRGNNFGVLLALADWSNDAGECWQRRVKQWADRVHVSPRTWTTITKKLAAAGYIQMNEGGGPGRFNEYRLTIPDPPLPEAQESQESQECTQLLHPLEAQCTQLLHPLGPEEGESTQNLRALGPESTQKLHPLPEKMDAEIASTQHVASKWMQSARLEAVPSDSLTDSRFDDSNHRARARKNGTASTSTVPPPGSAPPPSQSLGANANGKGNGGNPVIYLNSVVADFSSELGDGEHVIQNASQARRLWTESGLGAGEFVELLYEAKRRTREYQGRNGTRGIQKKMPYFFTVVRDLLSSGPSPPEPEAAGELPTAPVVAGNAGEAR